MSFIWPHRHFEREPEAIASVQIFLYTSLVVLAIRGSLFVYYLAGEWNHWINIGAIQILFLIGGLIIFRRTQKLTIAAHFPAISYLAMAIPTMWATQGINSPIMITLPVVVFYVLASLGLRWAVVWAFILTTMVIIFYSLGQRGILPPSTLSEDQKRTFYLLNYLVGILIFIWLYALYAKVFLKLKDILREQRQESAHVLRVISHDLRSPLQIIHSYGQLLTETDSKEKMSEYVQNMQRSLDRITGFLDQVQSYESVMGGKKLLNMQTVDLVEIIHYLLESVAPQYTAKKIKIEFSPLENETYFVIADPVALQEQVLANFLTNSLKFTPKHGTIRIDLKKVKNRIFLTLSDSGIGMSQATIDSMFSFSKNTSKMGTEGEKGTGFGMPIAKLFLDRMKIESSVESREQESSPQNHGTTIILKFKAAD